MIKTEKMRLVNKIIASSIKDIPLDDIREVLVLLKVQNKSWKKIETFLQDEGYNFSIGQIRYYFQKRPITDEELSKALIRISQNSQFKIYKH